MSNLNPKEIADRVLKPSPVIGGRTKLTTEEVLAAYPNGISICAVDFLNSRNDDNKEETAKQYAVFNIAEDPGVWFGGGYQLTTLFAALLAHEEVGGDLAVLNAILAKEPVKVRLSKGRTKKGNHPMIEVEVI